MKTIRFSALWIAFALAALSMSGCAQPTAGEAGDGDIGQTPSPDQTPNPDQPDQPDPTDPTDQPDPTDPTDPSDPVDPNGCNFDGAVAVKVEVDVSWEGGLALESGSDNIEIFFLANLDQNGNSISATGNVCDVRIPEFQTLSLIHI